jgi:hypothetical protein
VTGLARGLSAGLADQLQALAGRFDQIHFKLEYLMATARESTTDQSSK